MLKIHLINMPFTPIQLPSIALTQLRAAVIQGLAERVSVEIHYMQHDFAHYLGSGVYDQLSSSASVRNSGFGDWFFRQCAFPDLQDNSADYYQRYFPRRGGQWETIKGLMQKKREGLDSLLESLVIKYGLDHADLVGFTSMFSQNISSFALARKIKERTPETITVIGGANCETPMGQEIVKHVKQIDYVFSGPSLKTFPRFVEYILDGAGKERDNINGVFSKTNYASQPSQAAIGEELDVNVALELDYEPFLERVEREFPDLAAKPVVLFETSRGCWWGEKAHCTFCGLNGTSMYYRAMEVTKARELIGSLFKYAGRVSRVESVDNIMPKEYLKELFPTLETPENTYLFYEVKADLGEEDVKNLSTARVKVIQPGIESLATSTLKLMKKGTTAFQNLLLLKYCLLYDVFPAWNLLIGFPGEEEDVYQKYITDLPLLAHLPPPTDAYPVRFDRYSPYFVRAKEYGLDLHPYDYYALSYPFDEESLANLAYYFEDRNIVARYMSLMIEWIDRIRDKITWWRTRWVGHDSLIPAKLHFKGDSTVVYDSRSGRVSEHDVGAVGRRVLEFLHRRPSTASAVASGLSSVDAADIHGEMALLQSRGFVFREGDRYLSLVLPRDSPPMTYIP